MNFNVSIGNYREPGAVRRSGLIYFTFEIHERGEHSLNIYDPDTFSLIEKIPCDNFLRGRICSICIKGDAADIAYLIEENGKEYMDPFCRRVIGREKWADPDRDRHDFKCLSGVESVARKDHPLSIKKINENEEEMVSYRLHMRGFTMDHSLPHEKAGNYKGFLSRLNYIKNMGFNTLVFQPLYDFEELILTENRTIDKKGNTITSITNSGKINYWGYGSASYFAPKASYFGPDPGKNFKKFVDTIHKNQMKLIMEMDFDEKAGEDFILDCLKYYVREYSVDGFRMMGLNCPSKRISEDPFLSDTYFFYDNFEPGLLESSGTYKRHLFSCDSGFMYPLRQLVNHRDGSINQFLNMMKRQNKYYGFVNYAATTTSGFTLIDSFSYIEKHNESNGEDNKDGNNFNFTSNYGSEGDTNSRSIWNMRLLSVRTSLAALFLGQGIPLLESGDEELNSQMGNNNAYCQDNKCGWVNFTNKKKNRELREIVKKLIEFRSLHPALRTITPKTMGDPCHLGIPDMSYHGKEPWTYYITDDRKAAGILYNGAYGNEDYYIMLLFNFYLDSERFALPQIDDNEGFFLVYSTDMEKWPDKEIKIESQESYILSGGSMAILLGKKKIDELVTESIRTSENNKPSQKTGKAGML